MPATMAKRHWLDPLARRLLIAAGHLPSAEPAAKEATAAAEIERELLALRLRQNPALRLRDAGEVRHAAALGWHLDVNRATAADWLRLPGCTPAQVDLLQRLRAGGVQLSGPEDLQRLLDLDDERIRCWQPLLEFRWYGSGPAPAPQQQLDLNQASAEQIGGRFPDLTQQRLQRLLQERSRGPFRDLADLQQRLQLPTALVEHLIGRVRFGEGPIGPSLPLRRAPR
jgi:DNA uptake protein ComE-like DNA-binding protein